MICSGDCRRFCKALSQLFFLPILNCGCHSGAACLPAFVCTSICHFSPKKEKKKKRKTQQSGEDWACNYLFQRWSKRTPVCFFFFITIRAEINLISLLLHASECFRTPRSSPSLFCSVFKIPVTFLSNFLTPPPPLCPHRCVFL